MAQCSILDMQSQVQYILTLNCEGSLTGLLESLVLNFPRRRLLSLARLCGTRGSMVTSFSSTSASLKVFGVFTFSAQSYALGQEEHMLSKRGNLDFTNNCDGYCWASFAVSESPFLRSS